MLLLNVIKCVLADVVGYGPGSISEHIVFMCIHDNTALFEFPLHQVGAGVHEEGIIPMPHVGAWTGRGEGGITPMPRVGTGLLSWGRNHANALCGGCGSEEGNRPSAPPNVS